LNLPSITDATQKYIINMTMKVPTTNASTIGPKLYGNNISVSDSTQTISLIPMWNDAPPDTTTWTVPGMVINQQIEYMYQDGSGAILSNIQFYR
jgi:hypothetical protein